jgi:hypothetical protein
MGLFVLGRNPILQGAFTTAPSGEPAESLDSCFGTAVTDGILTLRYLLGFTGDTLVGAVGDGTTPPAIASPRNRTRRNARQW